MADRLQAGVIGAGVFGGHHARKYADRSDVSLAAIYDPCTERASTLAESLGAAAVHSQEELLSIADVVTIAAPAPSHYEIAMAAIAAGVHAYVEKPLALRTDHADTLIEASRAAGVILHVGHQERFVLAQTGLLTAGDAPQRIEFSRCGPASGRCEDVSAVYDLMIHDLDMAATLGFSDPVRVSACGGDHEIAATLDLADGRRASFFASRRSETRRRRLLAEFSDGDVEIDFLARTARSRRTTESSTRRDKRIELDDPLADSVAAFIAAAREARDGVETPSSARTSATADSARSSVDMAARIEEARHRLNDDSVSAGARSNKESVLQ